MKFLLDVGIVFLRACFYFIILVGSTIALGGIISGTTHIAKFYMPVHLAIIAGLFSAIFAILLVVCWLDRKK